MRIKPEYIYVEIGSNAANKVSDGSAEALGFDIGAMLEWLGNHIK